MNIDQEARMSNVYAYVQTDSTKLKKKTKKKCHGNRKLQHFKRKCRARGVTEQEIMKLIETRNNQHPVDLTNNIVRSSDDTTKKNMIKKKKKKSRIKTHQQRELLKRETHQIRQSLNQLTISRTVPKRPKNEHLSILNTDDRSVLDEIKSYFLLLLNFLFFYILFRPSKYLNMPKKLLFHSLTLHCNHMFKKRKEKHFVLRRLHLLDRQFCISLDLHLYRSYFTDGSHYHIWPVS